ncbi:MAG TPA: hypothetical protein VEZ48_03235 [Sphingomonadaceae bacterium]|nr:hypothetical protein [Sphingomonadaceae bacterium]
MNQITNTTDTSKIVGWGHDADRENNPTYPMRDRDAQDRTGADWQSPPAQRADVEVLQSIEYNRRPAVVGTSTPPSGVSGAIRRAAFRYSESDWRHWLMLLGADRINMVEGVVQDLGRGKIPNIPGEMGIRSELRHNQAGFAKKVAVATAIGTVFFALSQRRKLNEGRREIVVDQTVGSVKPDRLR